VEKQNEDSILATKRCKADRVQFPDVGPPLQARYGYFEPELQNLTEDEELVSLVGPLPVFLREVIVVARRKAKVLADQQAAPPSSTGSSKNASDKSKSRPLPGSMVMVAVDRVPGVLLPVSMPEIFLQTLASGFYPPLHWFTDDHIREAQFHLPDLPTRLWRPQSTSENPNPEKVTVFDMTKMALPNCWGSEELRADLTPLKWMQCLLNLNKAMDILSETPMDPTKPTFSGEMKAHRLFFITVPNLEEDFADIQRLELELRLELFKGLRFSAAVYAQRVEILRQTLRVTAQLVTGFSPNKRPIPFGADTSGRPAKLAKTTDLPAQNGPSPSPAGQTTSMCLICGGTHPFREHPTSVTSFPDGRPLFACLRPDGFIWTVRPFNGRESKRICITFNLRANKGCDGRSGGTEHWQHICSLCGKDSHGATSRHPSCGRFEPKTGRT
jgi:hypothetical protein